MIKVGFCVAYDWHLLKSSVPRIYDRADKICFSIDRGRRSWSRQPYAFDNDAFFAWIKDIDHAHKIDVYEDDFSLEGLTAMENDSRQRTMMGQRMGIGGWHVQVDSDEYFVDFKGFCEYLLKLNPNPTGTEKPYNVHVYIYDLFKRLPDGFLIVTESGKRPFTQPFATTQPVYESARQNGHFNKVSPFYIVHETWARGEEELTFKLANWGHVSIELKDPQVRESYLNFWRIMDKHNCKFAHNFHFAVPVVWGGLKFVQADSIETLLRNFKPDFNVSSWYIKIVSSRVYGKFRQVIHKIKSRRTA
jgi:hypothetical protein